MTNSSSDLEPNVTLTLMTLVVTLDLGGLTYNNVMAVYELVLSTAEEA